MPLDWKGDIGYITTPSQQQRPQKVKATLASIPVGTEDIEAFHSSQSLNPEWPGGSVPQGACTQQPADLQSYGPVYKSGATATNVSMAQRQGQQPGPPSVLPPLPPLLRHGAPTPGPNMTLHPRPRMTPHPVPGMTDPSANTLNAFHQYVQHQKQQQTQQISQQQQQYSYPSLQPPPYNFHQNAQQQQHQHQLNLQQRLQPQNSQEQQRLQQQQPRFTSVPNQGITQMQPGGRYRVPEQSSGHYNQYGLPPARSDAGVTMQRPGLLARTDPLVVSQANLHSTPVISQTNVYQRTLSTPAISQATIYQRTSSMPPSSSDPRSRLLYPGESHSLPQTATPYQYHVQIPSRDDYSFSINNLHNLISANQGNLQVPPMGQKSMNYPRTQLSTMPAPPPAHQQKPDQYRFPNPVVHAGNSNSTVRNENAQREKVSSLGPVHTAANYSPSSTSSQSSLLVNMLFGKSAHQLLPSEINSHMSGNVNDDHLNEQTKSTNQLIPSDIPIEADDRLLMGRWYALPSENEHTQRILESSYRENRGVLLRSVSDYTGQMFDPLCVNLRGETSVSSENASVHTTPTSQFSGSISDKRRSLDSQNCEFVNQNVSIDVKPVLSTPETETMSGHVSDAGILSSSSTIVASVMPPPLPSVPSGPSNTFQEPNIPQRPVSPQSSQEQQYEYQEPQMVAEVQQPQYEAMNVNDPVFDELQNASQILEEQKLRVLNELQFSPFGSQDVLSDYEYMTSEPNFNSNLTLLSHLASESEANVLRTSPYPVLLTSINTLSMTAGSPEANVAADSMAVDDESLEPEVPTNQSVNRASDITDMDQKVVILSVTTPHVPLQVASCDSDESNCPEMPVAASSEMAEVDMTSEVLVPKPRPNLDEFSTDDCFKVLSMEREKRKSMSSHSTLPAPKRGRAQGPKRGVGRPPKRRVPPAWTVRWAEPKTQEPSHVRGRGRGRGIGGRGRKSAETITREQLHEDEFPMETTKICVTSETTSGVSSPGLDSNLRRILDAIQRGDEDPLYLKSQMDSLTEEELKNPMTDTIKVMLEYVIKYAKKVQSENKGIDANKDHVEELPVRQRNELRVTESSTSGTSIGQSNLETPVLAKDKNANVHDANSEANNNVSESLHAECFSLSEKSDKQPSLKRKLLAEDMCSASDLQLAKKACPEKVVRVCIPKLENMVNKEKNVQEQGVANHKALQNAQKAGQTNTGEIVTDETKTCENIIISDIETQQVAFATNLVSSDKEKNLTSLEQDHSVEGTAGKQTSAVNEVSTLCTVNEKEGIKSVVDVKEGNSCLNELHKEQIGSTELKRKESSISSIDTNMQRDSKAVVKEKIKNSAVRVKPSNDIYGCIGTKVVNISATHKMTWVRFHQKVVTKLISPSGKFFIMSEILRRCFRIEEPNKNIKIQNILILKNKELKIPDLNLEETFYETVVKNLKERKVIKTVPKTFSVICEEDANRLFHYVCDKKYCGDGCVLPWLGSKKQATKEQSGNQKLQTGLKTEIKTPERNIFKSLEMHKGQEVIDLCSDEEDGYKSDTTIPYVDGEAGNRLGEFEKQSNMKSQSMDSSVAYVSNITESTTNEKQVIKPGIQSTVQSTNCSDTAKHVNNKEFNNDAVSKETIEKQAQEVYLIPLEERQTEKAVIIIENDEGVMEKQINNEELKKDAILKESIEKQNQEFYLISLEEDETRNFVTITQNDNGKKKAVTASTEDDRQGPLNVQTENKNIYDFQSDNVIIVEDDIHTEGCQQQINEDMILQSLPCDMPDVVNSPVKKADKAKTEEVCQVVMESDEIPSTAYIHKDDTVDASPSTALGHTDDTVDTSPSTALGHKDDTVDAMPSTALGHTDDTVDTSPSTALGHTNDTVDTSPTTAYVYKDDTVHTSPSTAYVNKVDIVDSISSTAYVHKDDTVDSISSTAYVNKVDIVDAIPSTAYVNKDDTVDGKKQNKLKTVPRLPSNFIAFAQRQLQDLIRVANADKKSHVKKENAFEVNPENTDSIRNDYCYTSGEEEIVLMDTNIEDTMNISCVSHEKVKDPDVKRRIDTYIEDTMNISCVSHEKVKDPDVERRIYEVTENQDVNQNVEVIESADLMEENADSTDQIESTTCHVHLEKNFDSLRKLALKGLGLDMEHCIRYADDTLLIKHVNANKELNSSERFVCFGKKTHDSNAMTLNNAGKNKSEINSRKLDGTEMSDSEGCEDNIDCDKQDYLQGASHGKVFNEKVVIEEKKDKCNVKSLNYADYYMYLPELENVSDSEVENEQDNHMSISIATDEISDYIQRTDISPLCSKKHDTLEVEKLIKNGFTIGNINDGSDMFMPTEPPKNTEVSSCLIHDASDDTDDDLMSYKRLDLSLEKENGKTVFRLDAIAKLDSAQAQLDKLIQEANRASGDELESVYKEATHFSRPMRHWTAVILENTMTADLFADRGMISAETAQLLEKSGLLPTKVFT